METALVPEEKLSVLWASQFEKLEEFISRPDVCKIYRRLHARSAYYAYLTEDFSEIYSQVDGGVEFWNHSIGGYRGLMGICRAARDMKKLGVIGGWETLDYMKYRLGYLYLCVVAVFIEDLVRLVLKDLPYLSAKLAVEIFGEIRFAMQLDAPERFAGAVDARLFPTLQGLENGFYEREGLRSGSDGFE